MPGGGAAFALVRGVWGRALSHPRPPVLWGVRPGPTTHWLFVRGVWVWGPVTNLPARALASWLCALWGWHEDAWGGCLLRGCGASGVGRSPTPDRPSFGACGRGPLPSGCACGRMWAWGPVTNPTARASASRLCALWGQHEGARGGAPIACVWGVWSRSLCHTRHPVLWGVRPGPIPNGCGCGGCGRGDLSPARQRALLRAGFARCGGGTRVPGGGATCLGVGRSGSDALPPSTARPLGVAAGARYPLAVGAGGCGHEDLSPTAQRALLRACLVRCGGGTRVPRGGASLASVWGVRGWALSHPRPPILWGLRPGPTTHLLWVREMRAWEPVTNPTGRALASWLCALWGRHEGAPGGCHLPGCGASGVGRSPTLDRPSFGCAAGARYPLAVGAGGVGVGPCHELHSARSCEMALRAVGAA